MAYKPKNETISDIYHSIYANLPLKGEAFPYDVRGDFAREWQVLEMRIEQYYMRKAKGEWPLEQKKKSGKS